MPTRRQLRLITTAKLRDAKANALAFPIRVLLSSLKSFPLKFQLYIRAQLRKHFATTASQMQKTTIIGIAAKPCIHVKPIRFSKSEQGSPQFVLVQLEQPIIEEPRRLLWIFLSGGNRPPLSPLTLEMPD